MRKGRSGGSSERLISILGAGMVGLLVLCASLSPRLAEAGCGCAKPPPPPAAVRPNVAYAGAPVTLFGSFLKAGQTYSVTFTSGTTPGASAIVSGVAAARRDLADGVVKLQLAVALPALPLGPAKISVTGSPAGGVLLTIPDSAFTIAPVPVAVPASYGKYHFPSFRAAVGRDGTAYISLDVTNVQGPLVLDAQAVGYPLRFTDQGVLFYNVQGFVMQHLVAANTADPIPGMAVFPAVNPAADSDQLHYSRHEFVTYFLQHAERQPHAVDPTDGNWHLDGSRHVDHNHLILAISGTLNGGALPAPGATPTFDLAVNTYSLFDNGLVGISSATMFNGRTDSYSAKTGLAGSHGDVFTNGTLTMANATINGNATASSLKLSGPAFITGWRTTLTSPKTFMSVIVPVGLPNLGTISLPSGTSKTIVGPGSFQVSKLSINGGSLFIDNSAGPVTLYVLGGVSMSSGSIRTANRDPEHFAIYSVPGQTVLLTASSTFYGAVYAPSCSMTLTGSGSFSGAFVADSISFTGSGAAHFDTDLRVP